jgi:uncharacterized protein involved in exopolysaccharide biosynthesis
MTTAAEWRDEEISLFAVGNTLLRNRWRIVRWMVLGGIIAGAAVITRKQVFKATASFIPEAGASQPTSSLASLAGQFGVSLSSTSGSQSPDFYIELLQSHTLLKRFLADTFTVQEMGGRRVAFNDLFEIKGESAVAREDNGVDALRGMVTTDITKPTGIVEVSVTTRWPSVSVAIAADLVSAVNDFNNRSRQSQAAAEQKFVEQRISVASSELLAAENRMQAFLEANREIGNSPQLTFEKDRIQREVLLRQQVYSTLMQSYEDVRMRAVRDTPVITPFEAPVLPLRAEARGRLKMGLLGMFLGALIGIALTFISEMFARSRTAMNPDANDFVVTLQEVKGEMLRPVRWVAGRERR